MPIRAIEGKTRILKFRKLSDRSERVAAKLALQTEHSWSSSKTINRTPTKDGSKTAAGSMEDTLSISAVASDDPVNNYLEEAYQNDEVVEVWDIDLSTPYQGGGGGGNNRYATKYARGLLNGWETPAPTEDFVTFDTELEIDLVPQKGFATVTEDEQEEIQYAFQDTTVFEDDDTP